MHTDIIRFVQGIGFLLKVDLRNNNLDLLRLIFALQVLLVHSYHLSDSVSPPLISLLSHFPGVPAFFFVSGFLIYASYSKTPHLMSYLINRFLRLWPGLLFVSIGGLCLVLWVHWQHGIIQENTYTYSVWLFSQLTIGQAWNPGGFRDVGVGVINGALWTITVEILFYVSVPVIFWLERYFKHTVAVIFAISFLCYSYLSENLATVFLGEKSLLDYLSLTPVIWGWMFMFGILVYKNITFFEKYSRSLFLAIPLLIFLAVLDLKGSFLLGSTGNELGLLYFIAFSILIIILAFWAPSVRLGFDISYGVYIWHMIIINFLLIVELRSVAVMSMLTVCIAWISWVFVESPMLKKKKTSLRPKS